MSEILSQLHDATLRTIEFDWARKSCTFNFAGAPKIPGSFQLTWSAVEELVVPCKDSWGESVSVLSAKHCGSNRYEFHMQSGDVIAVVSPNYSFKSTVTGRHENPAPGAAP